MKSNVGNTDKVIRIVLALVFIGLKLTGIIEGILGLVLLILGIVFIGTSLIGFCPLYTLFGFNTCPVKKEE